MPLSELSQVYRLVTGYLLAGVGSATGGDHTTVDASPDIDDDESARQAYNRMLAALHRRDHR